MTNPCDYLGFFCYHINNSEKCMAMLSKDWWRSTAV